MVIAGVLKPSEQVIPDGYNLLKILIFFVLITVFFSAGHFGAVEIASRWPGETGSLPWMFKWTWLLIMGVLASMVIVGFGILAHDAVHKVLFSRL